VTLPTAVWNCDTAPGMSFDGSNPEHPLSANAVAAGTTNLIAIM
jgi:hypothetical protein